MARLNNDAREILCNMVTEKAEAKRKKLTEDLAAIDNKNDADYKARIAYAQEELECLVASINHEIDRIFRKHKLTWGTRYGNRKHTFEDIFDDGKLKINLCDFIANDARLPNRRSLVETQLQDLDARVAKAKQEILLRAALGMKYDEVVSIINGFQF